MAKLVGLCHICGFNGPLTFEHIPPASAFNGEKVLLADVEAFLSGKPEDEIPKRIQQRGMGRYVLCGPCNNKTGAWYARAYAGFAHQAMKYLRGQNATSMEVVALPYRLYPLRVVKQVAAMMLAVNGPGFQAAQPELVRFVLSPEQRYWPLSSGRLYMAYLDGSAARQNGMAAAIDFDDRSNSIIFSEMSFRPFTFILSHEGPLRNNRFLDLTPFAHRSFNEWTILHFKTPVLSLPDSALPGTFVENFSGRPFSL